MTEEEKARFKALRKQIDEWAKEHLAGKKVWITELNQIIEFRYRNGIEHDLSRSYHEPFKELELIRQFPELLLTAIYMGFDKNTDKTQKKTKGVHNFWNLTLHEQKLYELWLKIKEDQDRLYYYDHGIIKEIE